MNLEKRDKRTTASRYAALGKKPNGRYVLCVSAMGFLTSGGRLSRADGRGAIKARRAPIGIAHRRGDSLRRGRNDIAGGRPCIMIVTPAPRALTQ